MTGSPRRSRRRVSIDRTGWRHKPNPRLSLVHEGVKLCKGTSSVVLAVGGGSVIDSARAIAMGAVMDHDVSGLLHGQGRARRCAACWHRAHAPAAVVKRALALLLQRKKAGSSVLSIPT